MSATGYLPIQLYYSTTALSTPSSGNLINGELAINITDGVLYYKDNTGSVQIIASKAAAGGVTSFSAGSTGLTPSTSTTGAVTLAGTLGVANGGTGLTSITANYIPYGNGTSALNTSANLTFNGSAMTLAGQLNLTNASNYNIYASGVGANYFAGNVGVGTTSLTGKLSVNGTTHIVGAGSFPSTGVGIEIVPASTGGDNYIQAYSRTGSVWEKLTLNGLSLAFGANGTQRANIASTGIISLGAAPGSESLRVTPVASAVNYLNVQGNTTTAAPSITSAGTDTNIDLALTPKGTGTIKVTGTGYSPNFTLTDAATIAWDTTTAGGQVATFTFVSSNRTMGAPTGLVNGGFYALAVIQNAGSNTLTWNSVFKWAAGTAPTLSTAAGAKDYFTFRSDGTNLYQQGISQAVA